MAMAAIAMVFISHALPLCDKKACTQEKWLMGYFTASRLKSVSEWLGLNMGELSPEAKGHVQTLAAISLALDLGDCSDTR